jgi:amino acid transporter
MLWEMAEINVASFGTVLSYILVYGILIFVLYKLKVLVLKNFLSLCVSFIPILFLWIYYYSIWSTKDMLLFSQKIKPLESYLRLYTFPFFIVIALIIYFNYKKHGKSYIGS